MRRGRRTGPGTPRPAPAGPGSPDRQQASAEAGRGSVHWARQVPGGAVALQGFLQQEGRPRGSRRRRALPAANCMAWARDSASPSLAASAWHSASRACPRGVAAQEGQPAGDPQGFARTVLGSVAWPRARPSQWRALDSQAHRRRVQWHHREEASRSPADLSGRGQPELQGRAQIGVLQLEPGEPRPLGRAEPADRRGRPAAGSSRGAAADAAPSAPAAEPCRGRTGGSSPAAGSAPAPCRRVLADQRATCRPARPAGRGPRRGLEPSLGADRLGRLQVEAAGEDAPAAPSSRRSVRRAAGRSSSRSAPAASAGAAARSGCRRSAGGSGRPAAPRSAPGDSTRTRAAASSIASGMPSSRRQISATAAALPSVEREAGRTAARPVDEQAHRLVAAHSAGAAAPGRPGSASDGTRQAVSPAMPSGSRLVARTRSRGQPRSSGVGQARRRRRAGARSCPAPAAGCLVAQSAGQRGRRGRLRRPLARPSARGHRLRRPAPGRPAAPARPARRRPG